jgi:hypothetical protein
MGLLEGVATAAAPVWRMKTSILAIAPAADEPSREPGADSKWELEACDQSLRRRPSVTPRRSTCWIQSLASLSQLNSRAR